MLIALFVVPLPAHTLSWVEVQPAGSSAQVWLDVASDADGSFLVASVYNGRLYTSSDSGANWTERRPAGDVNRYWFVDVDADGSNIIAASENGRLYTSSDSGANWTERQPAGNANKSWTDVASDDDGSHLIAIVGGGRMYTSSDSGANWTERQPGGDADLDWNRVDSDSDGSHLIASIFNGRLYTSSDGGVNWTERQPAGNTDRAWNAIASDGDGSLLVAAIYNGRLYTSSDSGNTWNERTVSLSGDDTWSGAAASSDGSRLVVHTLDTGSEFYTSFDSGATWIARSPVGASGDPLQRMAIDSDGSNFIAAHSSGRVYVGAIGTTPPEIVTLAPADGATGVSQAPTLEITFDNPIYPRLDGGDISIKKVSDNTIIQSFAVTDDAVTGFGTATLEIEVSDILEGETEFYIEIPGDSLADEDGNSFDGILGATTWNFTTGETDPPVVTSFSPANGSTTVNTTDNLVINFDEPVTIVGGTFTIKRASDNATMETISMSGGQVAGGGSATLTINPGITLESGTRFYIEISAGSLEDEYDNSFAGISGSNTWSFTTTGSLGGGLPAAAFAGPVAPVGNFQISVLSNTVSSGTVQLNFNAGPDTKSMAISEDPSFSSASIEPYTSTKQFALSPDNGTKTVYVKFYTAWGVSSSPISTSVTVKQNGEVKPIAPVPVPTVSSPSPSQPVPVFIPAFRRNLVAGSSGDDVQALQIFLNARGFLVAKTGPGSIGNETKIFGTRTKQALILFQKANKIPAFGYFGPITRTYIANLQTP